MTINGVNYDSYLEAIAQTASTRTENSQTEKTAQNQDTYTSTLSNLADAIPSATYGSNGLEIETFLPVTQVNTDTDTNTIANNSATTGFTTDSATSQVGKTSGGGSSDSDDETETEIVTIDGITYLQTTTTDENGNTTVTRVPLGTAADSTSVTDDTTTTSTAATSTAAQALSEI